jgi:O-antigen ligase
VLARLRSERPTSRVWILGIVASVLFAAAFLGSRASARWLALPLAGLAAFALLQQPVLGLLAVVAAALVARFEIGTGTEVPLNPAMLLLPALLGIWVLDMMRRGELRLAPSRVNRPLLLFLLAGLLSLVIGLATWDPAVPRSDNFALVQLAQWAVFAFAGMAFWLTGNLVQDTAWLRRLVFTFLALGGALALLRVMPGTMALARRVATLALDRSPFWMLLAAVAGGQLLFNGRLSRGWQLFLGAALAAVGLYTLYWERATLSHLAGVAAALGTLAWLRWPRLRWPVVLLLVALAVAGGLFSTVYEFAGGKDEWAESGGSRLVLIGRVLEVTMRNPITGLGPAAYRQYAGMEPLPYGRAYWVNPQISSHNNYVDLFSHTGLVGLALLFWFAVEVARLGLRLRAHFRDGFAAGYLNGMLAAAAGALALMVFADWMLPFVYNIGFPGFQAAIPFWLFLGGLVSLEQIAGREGEAARGSGDTQ